MHGVEIQVRWTMSIAFAATASSARAPEIASTLAENRTMSPHIRSFATLARSALIACVAASAFLTTTASVGQVGQVPDPSRGVPGNAQQDPAPVDPQSMSCSALKGRLQSSGQLTILSGPRGGWGDTFYGPAAPRCQFWQMPQFQYVRARDGLCGVGYICVDKMSFD